jgi:putative flippase GtrA
LRSNDESNAQFAEVRALIGPALRQMLNFGIVGGIGFVVDASVLHVGVALGLGLYMGRVLSYLVAVTSTWVLNRRYTFGAATGTSLRREWVRYAVSQLSGATVNLSTYSLLVSMSATCAAYPTLAVAAGCIAGMLINFTVARHFVFRSRAAQSL